MKLLIVLIVAILTGCATGVPSSDWQGDGYRRQLGALMQRQDRNELTIGQVNRQMIAVSTSFFPGDRLLVDYWSDLAHLGEQVDRNELTRDQYEKLADMRTEIFADANQQRHRHAEYAEAQERRALFLGAFLGNMGRSMQRSNPAPISCSTTSMPGVLTTNCR